MQSRPEEPTQQEVENHAPQHAGWLHNRYVVSGGQTAYERASDRCYSGKIAMFAEDVLGYLRIDKGGPSGNTV